MKTAPRKKLCDNVIFHLQQSKSALKLKKKLKILFCSSWPKKNHGK